LSDDVILTDTFHLKITESHILTFWHNQQFKNTAALSITTLQATKYNAVISLVCISCCPAVTRNTVEILHHTG